MNIEELAKRFGALASKPTLLKAEHEEARNLIIIDNAHRDFVYVSRSKVLKLRYICRLYTKDLVHSNFPGLSPERLLERMVELSTPKSTCAGCRKPGTKGNPSA